MLSRNAIQEGQTKQPVPARYLCPITHEIMLNPVIAADGRTYEREAIETWLASHDTSPTTNLRLKNKELIENFDKRSDIAEYLEEHPELDARNQLYLSKPIIRDLVMTVSSLRAEINHLNYAVKINQGKLLAANELPKFLQLVVEGEQGQAEAMLKQQPDLGLYAGSVTDLSGRTFSNITGFQYAVWALDSDMWNMILNYLPFESVQEQLGGLETGSWIAQHGKSASWQNLIDALDIFLDLCRKGQWGSATNQWCGAVGNAQQQLPVHVVNQYCHPNRSFNPCPNFSEETYLPRSRKTDYGDWFRCKYNGKGVGGGCFAICRGAYGDGLLRTPAQGVNWLEWWVTEKDRTATASYLAHKKQLQTQLISKYKTQIDKPSQSMRLTHY